VDHLQVWAQTVDRLSKPPVCECAWHSQSASRSPGHGLDVHPEMPIPVGEAEVCTEAAILY
jgi:hypothetical protein